MYCSIQVVEEKNNKLAGVLYLTWDESFYSPPPRHSPVKHKPLASCVGIQKHFMVAEIPGFDLPNRLSDLTTLLFSRDGIGKLIFNEVK
jgi:hypothetical protein